MHRKPTLLLAAALAALALVPGAASAAAVARDGSGALVYTANAGATNHVDVQQLDAQAGDITFYTGGGDTITTIAAGCAQSDIWPGEVVTCTAASAVRVDLGDGNDRGVVSDGVSVPVTIAGGPGSDVLDDGPQPNTLDGGPGTTSSTAARATMSSWAATATTTCRARPAATVSTAARATTCCTPTAMRTRRPTWSTADRAVTPLTATTPAASATSILRWRSRWPAGPMTAAPARAMTSSTSRRSR